jgi:hypothetical protein
MFKRLYALFKKYLNAMAYGAIGFVIGFSLIIVFLLFKPYNDVRYTGPITTDKIEYEVGGVVQVTISGYCNDGKNVSVSRRVQNDLGAIYLLPLEFNAPPEPACLKDFSATIQLPLDIPPGNWKIRFENSYNPNITFRTIREVGVSNEFNIVEKRQVENN